MCSAVNRIKELWVAKAHSRDVRKAERSPPPAYDNLNVAWLPNGILPASFIEHEAGKGARRCVDRASLACAGGYE
jgi:hypothetical protein